LKEINKILANEENDLIAKMINKNDKYFQLKLDTDE
jgi:hypothetical protein